MSRPLTILIAGDRDVGKSNLIDAFNKTTEFTKQIKGREETIKLVNVKTQREFLHKKEQFLESANCILLCYDLTNEASLNSIKSFWLEEIESSDYFCPIILCCMKDDNAELSINDTFSINKVKKQFKTENNIKYFMTCSSFKEVEGDYKNDGNVQSVFKRAIKLAYYRVYPKVSIMRTLRKSIRLNSVSLSVSTRTLTKKRLSSAIDGGKKLTILVLGDKKVGKTNFVRAVANDEVHEEAYLPKVWEKVNKKLVVNEREIEIDLFDTGRPADIEAELEEFDKIDGIILCFSIDSKKSWSNIKTFWFPFIGRHYSHIPVILCGTKNDCKRAITASSVYEELDKIKKIKVKGYLECSSRVHKEDGGNYNTVLEAAIEAASEPQPMKRLLSKLF